MVPSTARRISALTIISCAALPMAASAQDSGDAASLMAMDVSSLRGEIQARYDAALAASTNSAMVNSQDTRYLWAIEAKAQCGIALGYLKSSTKDETSIVKCANFYNLMMRERVAQAPPPPPPPPPPLQASVCNDRSPRIVFFDWDSAVPPPSAADTLQFISQNAAACNWSGLSIVGHTDLSGSDQYNQELSQRRADAVASVLASNGVSPSLFDISAMGENMPRVPTPDGVRSPQNRRVEITIK